MPTEQEIEAAAKQLCKFNGNCIHEQTGKDLCPDPQKDCRDWRGCFVETAVVALEAAEGVRSVMPEGHDKACYYCGDPCNGLAGNPAKWPIPLCHKDDPGRVKWHHAGCVMDHLVDD